MKYTILGVFVIMMMFAIPTNAQWDHHRDNYNNHGQSFMHREFQYRQQPNYYYGYNATIPGYYPYSYGYGWGSYYRHGDGLRIIIDGMVYSIAANNLYSGYRCNVRRKYGHDDETYYENQNAQLVQQIVTVTTTYYLTDHQTGRLLTDPYGNYIVRIESVSRTEWVLE